MSSVSAVFSSVRLELAEGLHCVAALGAQGGIIQHHEFPLQQNSDQTDLEIGVWVVEGEVGERGDSPLKFRDLLTLFSGQCQAATVTGASPRPPLPSRTWHVTLYVTDVRSSDFSKANHILTSPKDLCLLERNLMRNHNPPA